MKIKFSPIDDTALHVYAGILIAILSGFGSYYFTTISPFIACTIGFGTGTIAGIAKEYLWDRMMKKGTFSKSDMMSTGWGALVGSVILRVIIDLLEK